MIKSNNPHLAGGKYSLSKSKTKTHLCSQYFCLILLIEFLICFFLDPSLGNMSISAFSDQSGSVGEISFMKIWQDMAMALKVSQWG